jgi:hypothetical protein
MNTLSQPHTPAFRRGEVQDKEVCPHFLANVCTLQNCKFRII